jgi:hypothetical protein
MGIESSAPQPEPAVPQVHSILFFGEVLPGHDVVTCRRQLQALLKCTPETMDSVFSGQRVSLRKGLGADDALHYPQRLAAIGLRTAIEPPLPSPLPLPKPPGSAPGASAGGGAHRVDDLPGLR